MFRLEQGKGEQLFRRGAGQLTVLLRGQLGHPVPGLAGDGHAYAAGGDDLAYLFQQHGGAVEIDLQNGLDGCLAGGDACGVHQCGDRPIALGFFQPGQDGGAGGEVHLRRFRIKARLIQQVGGLLGVGQDFITDQNFLAGPHPAGDGQADLTGAGQKQHVFLHGTSSSLILGFHVIQPLLQHPRLPADRAAMDGQPLLDRGLGGQAADVGLTAAQAAALMGAEGTDGLAGTIEGF